MSILLDDHDYTIGTVTYFAALYGASQWIIHSNYNPSTQINDIALLVTTNDIQYSRGVGPICLPYVYATETFDSVPLVAAGWGTIFTNGPSSKFLQKVTLYGYPVEIVHTTIHH